MSGPVVAFLSDYGLHDGFVGVCHGVIVRGCPDARVIDLTHEIPPQDVHSGALVLASSIEYLPDAAVHLAVVDPDVGTARRAIAVLSRSGARFVGPDNGLLEPASLVVLARTRASREDGVLVAHVQYVDQFGNLQLDADGEDLAWVTASGPVEVVSSAWDRPPLAVSHGVTFADVSTGELVLYEDGHRSPAIAVNRGSAAERLGLGVGDELRIAAVETGAQ
jgi:S-adenosyl-L-methionine hydrolase (adenosine-forming)